MTPRVNYLLNQTNVYLNIATVVGLATIIWFASQTYKDVQDFRPAIQEFQQLKIQQQLVQKDISQIKQKLQMYDIEIQK